jgi:predicted GIY-YIG superfamily endonuclease
MEKGGWVYIMANRYRGGMYVGVTSDLVAAYGSIVKVAARST